MLFFKYQTVNNTSISMLKKGEIFFASPDELNDVCECKPIYLFQGGKEVWSRFVYFLLVKISINLNLSPDSKECEKILSLKNKALSLTFKITGKRNVEYKSLCKLMAEVLTECMQDAFNKIEKDEIIKSYIKIMINLLDQELKEDKYISSFSLNANNPTMWGLYGNADKGFVIIYESTDENVSIETDVALLMGHRIKENGVIELGHYCKADISLRKVEYASRPVRVNAFNRLIHKFMYSDAEWHYDVPEILHSDITEINENDIGFLKYKDWRYEKETRLIFPVHGELNSSLRCARVKSEQIKGIILGAKISNGDTEKVLTACMNQRSCYPTESDFFVFKSESTPSQYHNNIYPLGLLQYKFYEKNSILKKLPFLSSETKNEMFTMAETITKSYV